MLFFFFFSVFWLFVKSDLETFVCLRKKFTPDQFMALQKNNSRLAVIGPCRDGEKAAAREDISGQVPAGEATLISSSLLSSSASIDLP